MDLAFDVGVHINGNLVVPFFLYRWHLARRCCIRCVVLWQCCGHADVARLNKF